MCLHHSLLQARLGKDLAAAAAPFTAEAWAPYLLQQLLAAGRLNSDTDVHQQQQEPASADQAVLAELSALCDVQVLSSAVLLVSQVASSSSTAELLQDAGQGWAAQAAAAADACCSRVQLPEQDCARPWWQQEVAGSSVQDAMQLTANVAWLLHCRQQVKGMASSLVAVLLTALMQSSVGLSICTNHSWYRRQYMHDIVQQRLYHVAQHACSPPMLPVQAVIGTCQKPSYAIALAAADGVHKPAQVQQAVLSALASAGSSITQQHVQALQDVLQSCCNGALPRTADQLHKLQLTAAEGDGTQQQQQQQQVRSCVVTLE
jgi:hypothetical protein